MINALKAQWKGDRPSHPIRETGLSPTGLCGNGIRTYRFKSYIRYQTISATIARLTIIMGSRSSDLGAIFIRPLTAPNAMRIRKISHALGFIGGHYTSNLYFF